jgi:hypothetical protein
MCGLLEGDQGLQATVTNDTTLTRWPAARVVVPRPTVSQFRDPSRAMIINGS